MADRDTLQLEPGGQDPTPLNLHDLPPELLEHIMFFLPLISILDLMVNKKLKYAYEQYLYRFIWVVGQPYRSLRLLHTLALRPDLALSVRELRINLKWCHPEVILKNKLPSILEPDGLGPLSSARNIRSLHIGGLKWLTDPSLGHIRRIVSRMELTSLMIEEPYSSRPNDDEIANQMVISDLRAILQSQRQIEFLCLASRHVLPALLNSIEVSDVPNLRTFQGEPQYVEPFLNAAPKLRELKLHLGSGAVAEIPSGELWNGHKIRALSIVLNLAHVTDWSNFGSFLERFPNTESLYLWSTDAYNFRSLAYYLEHMAPRLCVLPLLQKLEIRGLDTTIAQDLDQTAKVLLKFKEYCPALEIYIDAEDRQWVYVPAVKHGRTFHVKLDRQLEYQRFSHRYDILPPNWDV